MIQWYEQKGSVGAYAETVAVDADWIVPLPAELDFVDGCTIPLNAVTAHEGLGLLDLSAPTTVLVTGASGAVGGFAVQLAVRAGHG